MPALARSSFASTWLLLSRTVRPVSRCLKNPPRLPAVTAWWPTEQPISSGLWRRRNQGGIGPWTAKSAVVRLAMRPT